MRFSICLALFFIGCSKNYNDSNCIPPSLRDHVIAFYPFTNGSIEDASGKGNHLTNNSTAQPTSDRNGNTNCAYFFNNMVNDDEFISTTNSSFLDSLESFSVAAWYYRSDDLYNYTVPDAIVTRGTNGRCPDRTGEWSLILFDFARGAFGHDNSVWSDTVPALNKWYHLIGVKDGDDYAIYQNGVLNETASGDAPCTNFVPAQDIGDLIIGHKYYGGIDDVMIFNKALTAQEAKLVYGMGDCCR